MLQIEKMVIAEAISAGSKMDRVEDECVVTCTDNGKAVTAVVMEYKPEKLTVVLNKSVKLIMPHNGKEYVGNMFGMEFTTPGPKITKVWDGKR